MRYRRRSTVVEVSERVTPENLRDIAAWCGGTRMRDAVCESDGWGLDDPYIQIPNPMGLQRAEWGDRVYRDENGDFWSIRESKFQKEFEPDV